MTDETLVPIHVGAVTGAAPEPVQSPSPTHIQDFIFVRELCEIYLLLDHISGRWDKSFPPTEPQAFSANDHVSVEAICRIGWPVVGNTVERAQQAATLLLAKDRLNAASKPANGATIAFTLMVVGEENRKAGRAPLARGAGAETKALVQPQGGGGDNSKGDAQKERAGVEGGWLGEHKTPPTRMYLAHQAFPGLINAATEFRQRILWLVILLLGFLIFTCLLSWYVAAGNIILTHLDAVHVQERDISKKIGLMVTSSLADNLKRTTAAGAVALTDLSFRTDPAPLVITPKGDPGKSTEECRAYFENILDRSKSAEPFYICDTLDDKLKEHEAISANLARWLFWKPAWSGPKKTEPHANNEELSRILTQVLISSVLPFFYGILGAGAAVLRDLWSKMRESCLSPRDSTLAYGQLALGAIIGACISLFISPAIAGAPGESVLGGFILTGSALSFVAGFGVEGVFQALESLVRRIFNNPDPTKKR
ncbi:MAG: hypothetical protein JWR40_3110 [Massilia sp.]|jgi:hypothetical protein|nr:hypothetical protein [Massilia sp.]MDB5949980.1 hypothetical protein [Massilia sp.]